MIEIVLEHFTNEGYECFQNIFLGGKISKVVAIKNKKITAFEFIKHATEVSTAIGQCLHYLNDANKVYIVIPAEEKNLLSQITVETLKQNGIGLTINNHKIETIVEAKEFEKNNISVIKDIKKKFISNTNHSEKDIKEHIIKILKEHSDGLTISDVSKLTSRNRITVSKYLAILEAEKIVECNKIAVSKIFRLKEHDR